jgi:hypothetical protein
MMVVMTSMVWMPSMVINGVVMSVPTPPGIVATIIPMIRVIPSPRITPTVVTAPGVVVPTVRTVV